MANDGEFRELLIADMALSLELADDFLEVLQDQAMSAAERAWWAPEIIVQGELANVADLIAPVVEVAPIPELQEIGVEPVIAAPLPPAPEVAPEPKDITPRS